MPLIRRIAQRTPLIVGSPAAFLVAAALVVAWIVAGAVTGFSDSWLLWPSAIASVVTFLIAFSLQYSQNRDTRAIQLKLDEILRVHERTDLVGAERLEDDELARLGDDERSSSPR